MLGSAPIILTSWGSWAGCWATLGAGIGAPPPPGPPPPPPLPPPPPPPTCLHKACCRLLSTSAGVVPAVEVEVVVGYAGGWNVIAIVWVVVVDVVAIW